MSLARMMGEADIKAGEREAIQRAVDEFIAKGGKIERVAAGFTTGKLLISKAGVIDGWVGWNKWAENF